MRLKCSVAAGDTGAAETAGTAGTDRDSVSAYADKYYVPLYICHKSFACIVVKKVVILRQIWCLSAKCVSGEKGTR